MVYTKSDINNSLLITEIQAFSSFPSFTTSLPQSPHHILSPIPHSSRGVAEDSRQGPRFPVQRVECPLRSLLISLKSTHTFFLVAMSDLLNEAAKEPLKEWAPTESIEDLFPAPGGINSHVSGAREEVPLPRGPAPIQLYSLATPNGKKVGIFLEELHEACGVEYDAHVFRISEQMQFHSGFTNGNPNSKIPMCIDHSMEGGPLRLFESASIILYFAEKYNKFWFQDPRLKAEGLNWIFWQMAGQGPITGNFGHFYSYAPNDQVEARNYGVIRYGMDSMRLADVLDKHLEGKLYMVNEEYSIVDMICFPWFQYLRNGYKHGPR